MIVNLMIQKWKKKLNFLIYDYEFDNPKMKKKT